MKITEVFNLKKSQYEVDFIDIDPSGDMRLFLDPYLLSQNNDNWSINARRTISNFWDTIVTQIRNWEIKEARDNLVYLSEPNETCLWLSKWKPRGRWVGEKDADKIFEQIIEKRVVEDWLVNSIEDILLFIHGFGKDKLSDLCTNIIKKHLSDYTIQQCTLHGIENIWQFPFWYWNPYDSKWKMEYLPAIVVNENKILLTPKVAVSYCREYVPEKYYNNVILNFIADTHMKKWTAKYIRTFKNGNSRVIKKELRKDTPYSKEFLREFTAKHKNLLVEFRQKASIRYIKDEEITHVSITDIIQSLVWNLQNTKPGDKEASRYHNLMIWVLELLFHPQLSSPIKECEIHEGRKRIDIAFDNNAHEGTFYRLSTHFWIPCWTIFVECKNYSHDLKNPEFDQLSWRFSPNRWKVWLLVCREVVNWELLLKRCVDTYKDGRWLIIPLTDTDIIEALNLLKAYDWKWLNPVYVFLDKKVRAITIE